MSLFYICMLPLLVSLGLWQVDRGAWKRDMEMAYLDQLTRLPQVPAGAEQWPEFTRLKLAGRLGDEVFLVDNQVSHGQTGYWVIQTMQVAEQKFLVNRGFLAAPKHRADLPQVETSPAPLLLTGVVWPFTGLIPVLDENTWPTGWPKRVQRLDIQRMAALTGAVPVEVRLEEGPWAPQPAPFAAVLSDATHRGYAATWFGLAIALSILYAIWGVRGAQRATRH